jgi:hypothetical protein
MKRYRTLFFLAALYNFAVALGAFAFHGRIFPLLGMEIPENPMWFQLFLGAVFVFGVGYYWVGRDPEGNRGLAALGVVGKVLVFLVLSIYFWAEEIPAAIWLLGVGDAIFAALFLEFLLQKNLDAEG